MKKSFKLLAKISIASVSLFLLGSCVANDDSPGLEYMPDMYRSPAIEPYVDYGEVRGREQENATNRISAKVPPFGAIPYMGKDTAEVALMLPYNQLPFSAFRSTHGLTGTDFTNTDMYETLTGNNPMRLNADNSTAILDKGKNLFTAMCQHCHGEKGDGQGPMVTSGAYTGVPNYSEKTALTDNQIFYTIYYGKGMMGAHGNLMTKKEIWTVVHYVRSLQDKTYGKFNADGSMAATPVSDSTVTTAAATN